MSPGGYQYALSSPSILVGACVGQEEAIMPPVVSLGSISATAAVDHLKRCPLWHAYRFHDSGYCDDCHCPTASWALADCWVSDSVGSWHQWTCPRCVQVIQRTSWLSLDVEGFGFVEQIA